MAVDQHSGRTDTLAPPVSATTLARQLSTILAAVRQAHLTVPISRHGRLVAVIEPLPDGGVLTADVARSRQFQAGQLAKAGPSDLIDRVGGGQTAVLTHYNLPFAVVRPAAEWEPLADAIRGAEWHDAQPGSSLEEAVEWTTERPSLKRFAAELPDPLIARGIRTFKRLLNVAATRQARHQIATASGIDEAELLDLVDRADLMRVKGVAGQYACLLKAAGVDTSRELAQRRPDNLARRLAEVNSGLRLVRRVPSARTVDRWVAHAKGLERVIRH